MKPERSARGGSLEEPPTAYRHDRPDQISWRSPGWVLAVAGGGQIALVLANVLGFDPPTPVASAIAVVGMLIAAGSLYVSHRLSLSGRA